MPSQQFDTGARIDRHEGFEKMDGKAGGTAVVNQQPGRRAHE
jgi:hypothetical protein